MDKIVLTLLLTVCFILPFITLTIVLADFTKPKKKKMRIVVPNYAKDY